MFNWWKTRKQLEESVEVWKNVALDLHEALGVNFGEDPYRRIKELLDTERNFLEGLRSEKNSEKAKASKAWRSRKNFKG